MVVFLFYTGCFFAVLFFIKIAFSNAMYGDYEKGFLEKEKSKKKH
jgi:hypothetical protein